MNGPAIPGQLGAIVGIGRPAWSPTTAMEMAARNYRAGDHAACARRCQELIARDAWHADALHLLGVVCLERAQFEEAVLYLARASRTRPDAAAIFFHLGNALMGRGQHEAAITALRRAATLAPGQVDVFNTLGNALAE